MTRRAANASPLARAAVVGLVGLVGLAACIPLGASDGVVVVQNGLVDRQLTAIFVTRTVDDRWGENLLGDSTVGPGTERRLRGFPPTLHDVRAEDDAGEVHEFYGLSVFNGGEQVVRVDATTVKGGRLLVTNATGVRLVEMALAPAGTSDWGPDLLVDGPQLPGDVEAFQRFDPGSYDVQAVTDGGERHRVAGVVIASDTETEIRLDASTEVDPADPSDSPA